MYTLVGAAKRNDIDPQAWLADVLGRTAETPQSQLDRLLPWSWVPKQTLDRAAQACSARRSITGITTRRQTQPEIPFGVFGGWLR